LALRISREYAWPTWGFREYMDILKSVWRLNSTLGGKDPMRIVGLDSDWDQYENWCGKSRTAMEDFNDNLAREDHLAKTLETALETKDKALVHIGHAHSLVKFKPRFAQVLNEKYGDKVFQVTLHQDLPGNKGKMTLLPLIESAAKENGGAPVAFDVAGSPFGELSDAHCVYFKHPDIKTFADLAEGYVFLAPTRALSKVTWASDFIEENNYERAKGIALKMKWIREGEVSNPKELNEALSRRFNGESRSAGR
jgi:hypothetical protein